jgi:hypothetical protein
MKIKMLAAALCLCCLALPVLGKALPDLKLTKLKASSITVQGNTKLIVKYTVKNIGTVPAPVSTTKISISSLNNDLVSGEQQCTPLKPNEEFSTSWSCPITKSGKYAIKAGANYNGAFPEMDQINNQNSISFGISRSL